MICTGDPNSGSCPCSGPGGPLQYLNSDGRWYLAGLASWGEGCDKAKKPGVYTNVAAMLGWIKSHFPGICMHCMLSVWYNILQQAQLLL